MASTPAPADSAQSTGTPAGGPSGRLAGRIAVITGASRGIGRAVAKRYAAEGAQTVLIARTTGALEELDDEIRAAGGLRPTLVPLDLRKGDEIDALGAALYERHGYLDVLVGNAAQLGILAPLGHIKPKLWDDAFAVNVTANYRLIRSLDPLLRRSEAGRAIFVTSGAAAGGAAYWSLYAATKAALEAMVTGYAAEVRKFGVKANLVDPGIVATALRAEAFPGENQAHLTQPDAVTEAFVELAAAECERTGEVVRAQA